MRRHLLVLTMSGVAGVLSLSAGCTANVTTNGPSSSSPTEASQVVGAAGGTVATSDGSAEVDIPPGALPADTTITIKQNASAPGPSGASVVGTPYTFGPDGLQFLKPITVTLAFDPSKLPAGAPRSAIVVYTAPDGATTYSPLPTTVKDETHVIATTTHFSTDVSGVNNGAQDAGTDGGEVCVSVSGGACATDASVGGGGGGGGGCTPTVTCANANPCAAYPGATVASCTDSTSGYSATCCFPPTAPTCFSVGAGCATSGGADASAMPDAGGPIDAGGGGGGGGCTSPPTCAASNPCGGYQGATVQSCTNNSSGYNAVCCLPPGSKLPGSGATDAGGGDSGIGADASGPPPQDGGTILDAAFDAPAGDASAPTDAGTAPDASGGADGGSGTCSLTCSGGAAGCDCNDTCGGKAYDMKCDGTTCVCTVNGGTTGSFAQGGTCGGPAQAQQSFLAGCGYPASGGDGGAADAGPG